MSPLTATAAETTPPIGLIRPGVIASPRLTLTPAIAKAARPEFFKASSHDLVDHSDGDPMTKPEEKDDDLRPRPKPPAKQPPSDEPTDQLMDDALDESFPASDPPSWSASTRIGTPRRNGDR
jgi:hypothetical protein